MNSENTHLKIRGHHLLCMLSWRGKGYDENFTENMEKTVKALKNNPASYILLTDQSDIICSACPHSRGGNCSKKKDSEKKVKNLDLKIISRFGLKQGETIQIKTAWGKIKKGILPKDLTKICGECEWLDYCASFSDFNI